jgi:hypothetical protein
MVSITRIKVPKKYTVWACRPSTGFIAAYVGISSHFKSFIALVLNESIVSFDGGGVLWSWRSPASTLWQRIPLSRCSVTVNGTVSHSLESVVAFVFDGKLGSVDCGELPGQRRSRTATLRCSAPLSSRIVARNVERSDQFKTDVTAISNRVAVDSLGNSVRDGGGILTGTSWQRTVPLVSTRIAFQIGGSKQLQSVTTIVRGGRGTSSLDMCIGNCRRIRTSAFRWGTPYSRFHIASNEGGSE